MKEGEVCTEERGRWCYQRQKDSESELHIVNGCPSCTQGNKVPIDRQTYMDGEETELEQILYRREITTEVMVRSNVENNRRGLVEVDRVKLYPFPAFPSVRRTRRVATLPSTTTSIIIAC